METTIILWLGCGALAVITVLWVASKKKKVEAKPETKVFDFYVSFWGESSGWHGIFKDGNIAKNGVLVGLRQESVMKGDVVRVLVQGMKDGLWQVRPLKLSHLPAGKVIATGERRNGEWKVIYPNEHGIALVGYVKTQEELQANKKYAVKKISDGIFTLL